MAKVSQAINTAAARCLSFEPKELDDLSPVVDVAPRWDFSRGGGGGGGSASDVVEYHATLLFGNPPAISKWCPLAFVVVTS